jgi:hypothetical protein
MDDVQKNNNELYQTIERLKTEIRESARAIEERDSKIDSMQSDVKRVLQEKADKENLIKSMTFSNNIFIALTQENLRLANECLELNQDGKINVMLRTEIDYLKD